MGMRCSFLTSDAFEYIVGILMEYEIDVDRLRKDLKDYYGTAMFSASPMAVLDLSRIERASDLEIVEEAQRIGVDLTNYEE